MCFTLTKSTQFRVATKDVPCYKILYYDKLGLCYRALYRRDHVYEIGKTYKAKGTLLQKEAKRLFLRVKTSTPNKWNYDKISYMHTFFYIRKSVELTKEVIHAYMLHTPAEREDALEFIEKKRIAHNQSIRLAKFIIPKGTWYMFDETVDEIVAPKMRFESIVEQEEK